MTRGTLPQKLAAALALWGIATVAAPVGGVEFADGTACRMNELPLGSPARIEARREGAIVLVAVAANFGCQTAAGRARVEERDDELRRLEPQ